MGARPAHPAGPSPITPVLRRHAPGYSADHRHPEECENMNCLFYDLIAQRAASLARIAEMRRFVLASSGDDRVLWEAMLAQYVAAMPSLDAQIAYAMGHA
jgi:hypothetical protein